MLTITLFAGGIAPHGVEWVLTRSVGQIVSIANNAQTLAYWAFLASMAAWPAARRASGTR